jgi:hypothetical protein
MCFSRLSEKSGVQRAEFITFWGKKTFRVSTHPAVQRKMLCVTSHGLRERRESERCCALLRARTETSRPPSLPSLAASPAPAASKRDDCVQCRPLERPVWYSSIQQQVNKQRSLHSLIKIWQNYLSSSPKRSWYLIKCFHFCCSKTKNMTWNFGL